MCAPRQMRRLGAAAAVAIALGVTSFTVGAQGPNVRAQRAITDIVQALNASPYAAR